MSRVDVTIDVGSRTYRVTREVVDFVDGDRRGPSAVAVLAELDAAVRELKAAASVTE